MDIHHIKYFLAVCKSLNFTRAAEECSVTQPALSRAIQQLEAEIGGQLFRRERNLTHLTDLGQVLRPRFKEALAELGKAKSDARQFLKLQKASLSLGVMCTIGPARFAGLLHRFRNCHPGITVELREGVTADLLHRLEAGEVDVALMAENDLLPERTNLLHLYSEPFVVAFAGGHRFEAMNAVPFADFDGENYLDRKNCEQSARIEQLLEACGSGVNVVYESDREDWIQLLVASGFGIAFLPRDSVFAPGLVVRPIVEPEIVRGIALVSLCGRRHSPPVEAFVKAAKTHLWQGA